MGIGRLTGVDSFAGFVTLLGAVCVGCAGFGAGLGAGAGVSAFGAGFGAGAGVSAFGAGFGAGADVSAFGAGFSAGAGLGASFAGLWRLLTFIVLKYLYSAS